MIGTEHLHGPPGHKTTAVLLKKMKELDGQGNEKCRRDGLPIRKVSFSGSHHVEKPSDHHGGYESRYERNAGRNQNKDDDRRNRYKSGKEDQSLVVLVKASHTR
jgi:hypothetical protein